MFVEVLKQKHFFKEIGIKSTGKIPEAIRMVETFLSDLRTDGTWKTTFTFEEVSKIKKTRKVPNPETGEDEDEDIYFETLIAEALASTYSPTNRQMYLADFIKNWKRSNTKKIWNTTAEFFQSETPEGKKKENVFKLLEGCILKGKIKILDLNPSKLGMEQSFKLFLIDFIFKRLRRLTLHHYKRGTPGNALIVMDEAGRFIPQYFNESSEDDKKKQICRNLVVAVKEMRKMRTGFLFITQSIAEIQKEVFRNLHFRAYGVGLGIGADAEHMRDSEGDESYELYKTLPDPRLSGTFSFLIAGVLLTLGSSGKPMIIEGFASDTTLIQENWHLVKDASNLEGFGDIVKI